MREKPRHIPRYVAVAAASAVLVATTAACGSSSPGDAASGACNSNGVSANQIQLGSLVSQTGVNSSVWEPFAQGVQARIDLQNAQGGIHGRTLILSTADDASSTAQNLSAAQQLVEGHHALAVLEGSANDVGSSAYLNQSGVPVVGFGFSPAYQQYKKTFISFDNAQPGVNSLTTVTKLWGQFVKSQGGTRVYVAGNDAPSSTTGSYAFAASATAAGLKVADIDANLPLATTNFTSAAEKAKAANVDSAMITSTVTAQFALISALRQAGVPLKTILVSEGYDPTVFKSGINLNGMAVFVAFAPFEENLPAQKTFNDAVEKYAHGSPDQLFAMYGYLSANLVIQGIENAGSCPSSQSVLNAITALRGYTAGGLIPATNFSLASRGQVLKCDYFVVVHNQKFTVANNGKPICVKGGQVAVPFSSTGSGSGGS